MKQRISSARDDDERVGEQGEPPASRNEGELRVRTARIARGEEATHVETSCTVAERGEVDRRRGEKDGQYEATYVGLFDYVRCRYPLSHHQDALLQTKVLLSLVDPGEWLSGLLENYEITKDGSLRRQRHKYKAVKTPRRFPSFHLKSSKSWWKAWARQTVATPDKMWSQWSCVKNELASGSSSQR